MRRALLVILTVPVLALMVRNAGWALTGEALIAPVVLSASVAILPKQRPTGSARYTTP